MGFRKPFTTYFIIFLRNYRVKAELRLVNESAAASLGEGLEETLTLHRLGLFPQLGISLKTTNCIESLMALVEDYTGKVITGGTPLKSTDGSQ